MFETQHKELVTIGIEIWLNSGVRVPADRGAEIWPDNVSESITDS